jgi:hypothetical protein
MPSGVVYNHIPEVSRKLVRFRDRLVRKTAFDIERTAKPLAPVRYGLLKNSIYTVTSDTSGAVAADQAMVRRKGIGSRFVDLTFPQLSPTGDPARALVVVGAKYGIFVEMGTIHMPARSYLGLAAQLIETEFHAAWSKLEEGLRT